MIRTIAAGATIIALAYVDRFACALADRIRAHRLRNPLAPASTRNKRGATPHLCAVCRERRATDGDLCDECSVWVTGLAMVNRDCAEEHAS